MAFSRYYQADNTKWLSLKLKKKGLSLYFSSGTPYIKKKYIGFG